MQLIRNTESNITKHLILWEKKYNENMCENQKITLNSPLNENYNLTQSIDLTKLSINC